MLGRRSTVTESASPEAELEATNAGKGRPTPKRADARKSRRNALPSNSKEASAMKRARARDQRKLTRQALMTGDERNLPARDAGPERRLARDIVDSHFTLGQVLFMLIFVSFVLTFLRNRGVDFVAEILALVCLTAMVLDAARYGRQAKTAVAERFGESEVRGISSYAFMRALLPRRFRRPPPKVKRGASVL